MIQDMIYHIILLLLNMYDTDNSMIQDILISVNIYIYLYLYYHIINIYIYLYLYYHIINIYYIIILSSVICNIISCLAKTGNGPSKSCLYPTDCSLGA